MLTNRIKQVFVKTEDFNNEDRVCPKCGRVGYNMPNNSIECLNCDTTWNITIKEDK